MRSPVPRSLTDHAPLVLFVIKCDVPLGGYLRLNDLSRLCLEQMAISGGEVDVVDELFTGIVAAGAAWGIKSTHAGCSHGRGGELARFPAPASSNPSSPFSLPELLLPGWTPQAPRVCDPTGSLPSAAAVPRRRWPTQGCRALAPRGSAAPVPRDRTCKIIIAAVSSRSGAPARLP